MTISYLKNLQGLPENLIKKFKDINQAKDHVKKAIACTMLLPAIQSIPIPNPPSNLLFWCTGWKQFNENDWFAMLLEIFREDLKIFENRNKIIHLGVIYPIDMPPMTR